MSQQTLQTEEGEVRTVGVISTTISKISWPYSEYPNVPNTHKLNEILGQVVNETEFHLDDCFVFLVDISRLHPNYKHRPTYMHAEAKLNLKDREESASRSSDCRNITGNHLDMTTICNNSLDDAIIFTKNVNGSSWRIERARKGKIGIRQYGNCHIELHKAIDLN
ncbi:unnamed protein product [Brugia pahangi]|uniref:Uncharacterized protein n=1 Tax=Brugia pahangi TaxID=6280 RepID=A0A0N4SX87_BRUPA|nr:unnamed protein product [Brugia pahangi]